MDQITLNGIIQLPAHDDFAVQQPPFTPPHLPAPLLVHEQPAPEFVFVDVQEGGEFVEVHGRVQFQVALDRGGKHVAPHLIHEDGGVMVHGIDVEGRGGEVRGRGRDEFRAGAAKQFFE